MMMRMKNEIGMLALAATLTALLVSPAAMADKVRLSVEMGSPLVMEGRTQTVYMKIGLTGFPLEDETFRTPVNVAIVLDRSGSMSGEKMRKAKEAAIMAIDRLGPDDIVSLIAYNHTVDVLIPSTKVRNRNELSRRINSLHASGNTALFAGVSKGAREIRKFLERNRVNRVILVSDGLANVGPSSPGDLGALGWSLAKEGISVTTVGLGDGYNEDLMFELAMRSDGNHAFAEDATDLAGIFSHEFGDVLSVVAREVVVSVECSPGVKPVRVLGRHAQINGRKVVAGLNQLYADQEKFVLLELEVPAGVSGMSRELASVDVRYANTVSQTTDVLGDSATVVYTDSADEIERRRNKGVMVATVELISNENNKYALSLRDQGKVKEAEQALEDNAAYLNKNAARYKSKKLEKQASSNMKAKKNLAPSRWRKQRKAMRDEQFELDMQQAW